MVPASIRTRRRVSPYQGPACPRCLRRLPEEEWVTGARRCPHCRRRFEATAFTPASPLSPAAGPSDPGGAGCASHPGNAATGSCGRCGVFLCPVCEIVGAGQLLCPLCFERLVREDALPATRTVFPDYGARAGSCAALGLLLCFPLGVVLGPLSIFYGIRSFTQKTESRSSAVGVVLAMLVGLFEFSYSAFVVVTMIALMLMRGGRPPS